MTQRLSAEFLALVALRRVRRGGVTRLGACFFWRGFPLGGLLGEALAQLIDDGALTQGPARAEDGLSAVWLTEAGRARFVALGGECGLPGLRVPAPEHGTSNGAGHGVLDDGTGRS